jgi:hypothetical protein
MILYLDTSALLKCLIAEAHSDEVREWIAASDGLATSRVTYPEAAAALARRQRRGDLSPDAVRRSLRRLADRWADLVLLDLTEIRAGGLAVRHALRGFDAVQLAAALTLRTALGAESVAFSSFDAELSRAAVAEGLIVLEPGG